ncbi:ubiquinone biosynthesis protein COQ9 [Cognatiyoonia koreensis]|uniref:Ubiquinone biosynthesis protein COQ9 n=1 Tax=Cognatiyoonia koreensis TaxID=364200 RepID=A0A1I0RXW7_9RHOB|nr:COQ9 family protein [Cognatiyoonia koreensis]SEW46248.1 ubiquinone biosynthesis protein COQ9 [Cognatiyoonia koreensis]
MHDDVKQNLLDAILPHVAFDGWSPDAFRAAATDAGVTHETARLTCPRGAVDLAVLYHQNGDAAMVAALNDADLSDMRFRDKVAHAIRLRLAAVDDKEAVRRGTTLFALPHMAPEGSKLIWDTADAIWTALGDTSDDINWYTKRATLSGVYGAVVLYWLGDDSLDGQATDAFIDRRIDNVMQFEKVKAGVNNNPLLKPITGPLGRMMGMIKAPNQTPRDDLPGRWVDPT